MRANKLDTGSKALKWIPAKDLRISDRAQRGHDSSGSLAKIAEIAANFDPDQFGTLTVNHRDGTYWVVDGGHRLLAVHQMGYSDQLIQCWVYEDLSEASEADLFLALNNVRVVSSLDKFKVAVVAGHDAEVEIDSIVHGLGLKVGTGRTNTIRCATSLVAVYEQGGPKVLESTLRIIRDAYGTAGFNARTTLGVGKFVARYEHQFSEERLVGKLSRKMGGVNGLMGRAEQIKSSHSVSGAEAVAAATVETYNQGRGGGKLPSWWATQDESQDES